MSPGKLSKSNRPFVIDCAFACVASAALTLLVCIITPARPIPDYCFAKLNKVEASISSLAE
jgi:hypothetical protein